MGEQELAAVVVKSLFREPGEWAVQQVSHHGAAETVLCRVFGYDAITVSEDGSITCHGSMLLRIPPREDVRNAYKNHPAVVGSPAVSKAISRFVKLLGG